MQRHANIFNAAPLEEVGGYAYIFNATPPEEVEDSFNSMTWWPEEQRRAVFKTYKELCDYCKSKHGSEKEQAGIETTGHLLHDIMEDLLKATKSDTRKPESRTDPDKLGKAITLVEGRYLPDLKKAVVDSTEERDAAIQIGTALCRQLLWLSQGFQSQGASGLVYTFNPPSGSGPPLTGDSIPRRGFYFPGDRDDD